MKALKFTKETILDIGVTDRKFPMFKAGDTICVTLRIVEAGKERLQNFEGTVIRIKGAGITKTFCVRKITDGVSIERILPYHLPSISSIKLINKCIVRRAKLYYLRDKYGKNCELKKEQKSKKQKVVSATI
jgi:large subunit ribosomal protein L19